MDALTRLQQIDRGPEIETFAVKLYFWSRNPVMLAGVAALMLIIGLAAGWFTSPAGKRLLPADSLRATLSQPRPDSGEIFSTLTEGYSESHLRSPDSLYYQPVEEWIRASKLPETEKAVVLAYQASITDGGEPGADLLWYAYQAGAPRFANESIGDLYAAGNRPEKAVRYYEREARLPVAESARHKAAALLLSRRDFAGLKTLLATPAFQRSPEPAHLAEIAASERRWSALPALISAAMLSFVRPLPAALAALAAVVWLAVIIQASQPPRVFSFRTFAPFVAVAAGIGSAWAALLAGYGFDHVWGLRQGAGLFGDVQFFVLGVGLREELLKLAFFVPFLPVLLVRKDRLEAICLAACVGLGFAAAENLGSFAEAGAASAMGRFLTANFFHAAATGLLGLALFDALREPARRGWVFLATVPALVLAHGLYDAFISFAQLRRAETLAGAVFMFTSLAFFRRLQPLRSSATDRLSIAATFVAGISVLVAVVFACTAAQAGFESALAALAVSGITLAMIIYMFYWQLGEGMSAGEETPHRPSYNV